MSFRPRTCDVADIYGVHRKQVERWLDKGINAFDPAKLAEALASQRRPGKTLDLLLHPGAIEQITIAINNLPRPRRYFEN
jgi:hypothetical protein